MIRKNKHWDDRKILPKQYTSWKVLITVAVVSLGFYWHTSTELWAMNTYSYCEETCEQQKVRLAPLKVVFEKNSDAYWKEYHGLYKFK